MSVYPCLTAIHLIFWVSFQCLPFRVCLVITALKLGCITNFDMHFVVMGFLSLIDEIQFMLISGSHHQLHKVYSPLQKTS